MSLEQKASEESTIGSIAEKIVRGVSSEFIKLLSFKNAHDIRRHAKPGDLLEFHRVYFCHYALYLGNGRVMNIGAEDIHSTSAWIKEMSLESVCGDSRVRIRNHDQVAKEYFNTEPRPISEILKSAQSYANRVVPYEFGFRNCEYYSTLWRFGKGFSTQAAKPTATPGGAVLGEVMTISESSQSVLNATQQWLESAMYMKYLDLVKN